MNFCKKYPSGLRLVAKRIEYVYSVSMGIYVNVGCEKETAENNGFSHFVEHLLFKGTTNRTSKEICEQFDDIGASYNAYTSKDATCFYFKSLSTNFEKCVDILSDIYFNSTVPEDELTRERGVVLEEISMNEDSPEDVVQDLIGQALFGNENYGQTILGNPDNIKYCDRHSILEFKNSHYTPSNTVISVVGNFDFDQLDNIIQRYFESQFSGHTQVDVEPKVCYHDTFLHKFKKNEQVHMQMATGTFGYNAPQFFDLCTMSMILGGSASSRLFQSIREEHGLAYAVYSDYNFYKNNGFFQIGVGLNASNIDKCCDLIGKELKKFVKHGVTEAEVNRAKSQFLNGVYVREENTLSLMRVLARQMTMNGTVYNLEDDVKLINAVSVDSVNALIHEIFAQKFACAYLGEETDNFDSIAKIRI